MKLPRIDEAIDVCQEHLDKTSSFGTEIESFITRYLLILICAAFEEEIEKIIINRANKATDPDLSSFVKSCLKQVFRSIKTSEIAGLLNRFGSSYKELFQQKINNSKAEAYFNNIVVNRHNTAHESGSSLTFKELVEFYQEGHTVLDAIVEVCN